jgi:hypothetical protein
MSGTSGRQSKMSFICGRKTICGERGSDDAPHIYVFLLLVKAKVAQSTLALWRYCTPYKCSKGHSYTEHLLRRNARRATHTRNPKNRGTSMGRPACPPPVLMYRHCAWPLWGTRVARQRECGSRWSSPCGDRWRKERREKGG